MAQLEGENLTIKSYQSTIHGLEIDRKNLQKQLKEMERAVRDITDVNKMAAVDSSAGASLCGCVLLLVLLDVTLPMSSGIFAFVQLLGSFFLSISTFV